MPLDSPVEEKHDDPKSDSEPAINVPDVNSEVPLDSPEEKHDDPKSDSEPATVASVGVTESTTTTAGTTKSQTSLSQSQPQIENNDIVEVSQKLPRRPNYFVTTFVKLFFFYLHNNTSG